MTYLKILVQTGCTFSSVDFYLADILLILTGKSLPKRVKNLFFFVYLVDLSVSYQSANNLFYYLFYFTTLLLLFSETTDSHSSLYDLSHT